MLRKFGSFLWPSVSRRNQKVHSSLDTEVIIENEIIKGLAYMKVHRNMPTPQMQSGAADLRIKLDLFNQIDKER